MKLDLDNIPPEVLDRLREMQDEVRNDCVDNERIALSTDADAVQAYDTARAYGCCGSWDVEFLDKQGRKWYIGLNYGH